MLTTDAVVSLLADALDVAWVQADTTLASALLVDDVAPGERAAIRRHQRAAWQAWRRRVLDDLRVWLDANGPVIH